ncbi:MAG: efflux RND transporter periplasmic adaptor subunit [Planctomycetes bacterium]|nr:efflux RND transporter periplasmic adaptor subunit [Planctomycetota bacterium]
MSNNNVKNGRSGLKSPKVIGAIVIVALICIIVLWLKVVRGSEQAGSDLVTFVAKRGPLTISVLESGTIKPRERIIIKNELEGRTSIISLLPEGTQVKKGDKLVELDASTLEDTLIDQEIKMQNAEAAFIDANEALAVAGNQAQSDIDIAKLTLTFAEQDLEQYNEGQYPKDLKTANNEITLREEELTRAQETLEWSQKLFEEKYLSNTDLQADKLAVTRSNNNLELAKEELRLLGEFTRQRNIDQFESDFHQAKMALERTQRKAKATVIQAKADLKAKELEYTRQITKLEKINDQLGKATILSPADGTVIYASSARRGHDNREPLDEGAEVYERQELIYLPTATSTMAEVNIHEASLEKVRLGLPAIVTVDALPGKTFFGSVGHIAPLPDTQSMWMNPDLKVYNSEVYLEGDTPDLRTGMSCKVEIIVQQYEDAVYIPVQAVIRIAGQPAVYVVKDGTIEEREVKIGLDNNRMIRIIDGIQEGEVVLLTPPLKSASIEDASGMINGGRAESSDELDTLKQRINEQLNGTNGTKTGGPDTLLDMKERREMQQQLLGAGKEQGESQKQGRDVRPQGTEGNR